jgi:hypothetical protein
LQIDDVDPVSLAEEEFLHLRIPAVRLVAEMDSGFQQFLDGHDSHAFTSPQGLQSTRDRE